MKKPIESVKQDTPPTKSIKNPNNNKKEKINYQKPFKLEMSFDEAVSKAGRVRIKKNSN